MRKENPLPFFIFTKKSVKKLFCRLSDLLLLDTAAWMFRTLRSQVHHQQQQEEEEEDEEDPGWRELRLFLQRRSDDGDGDFPNDAEDAAQFLDAVARVAMAEEGGGGGGSGNNSLQVRHSTNYLSGKMEVLKSFFPLKAPIAMAIVDDEEELKLPPDPLSALGAWIRRARKDAGDILGRSGRPRWEEGEGRVAAASARALRSQVRQARKAFPR